MRAEGALTLRCFGLLLALVLWAGSLRAASDTPSEPMAGIDHVPTVVADLDTAVAQFQALGFAVKPGRPHADGLRNAHIKFPDGSGIELIQPPSSPTDALTREYQQLLRQGEGPVFLALHVRDTDALRRALDRARIGYTEESGNIQPDDPHLRFLFLVRDNRSPSDRPEHFAHPNTADALSVVWIEADTATRSSVSRLLTALGSPATIRESGSEGHLSLHRLLNGCIVLAAAQSQRPLRRMAFSVADTGAEPRGEAKFSPTAAVPAAPLAGIRWSFVAHAAAGCDTETSPGFEPRPLGPLPSGTTSPQR